MTGVKIGDDPISSLGFSFIGGVPLSTSNMNYCYIKNLHILLMKINNETEVVIHLDRQPFFIVYNGRVFF